MRRSMFRQNILKIVCLTLYSTILSGYTIDQSGLTVIGAEVLELGDVITITVSDVTLDLDGNRVTGGDNGIIINSGLSNITIKNGRIESNTVGISIQDTCSFITLQDLEISQCSDRAIECDGSSGNEITTILLKNVEVDRCSMGISGDHAIFFNFTDDITVQNLSIVNSGAASIAFRAINMISCDKGLFENVTINCNTGSTLQGIHVESVTNTLFENIVIKMNTATMGLQGMQFSGGTATTGNVCRNFLISSNESTSGPVSGFELLALVTRNTIRESLVNYNVASGATATSHCYGFNLDQPTFCSIVNCVSEYNRATGDGSSNNCAGFNISTSGGGTTGTKNCQFCGNKAFSNNGFNDARSFGIRAVSASGGNENNVYLFNIAGLNGPTTPIANNQIVDTTGSGSSPGGVPAGSVRNRSTDNLNFDVEYGNLRIDI